jgi:signal transduction histidine kinase
MNHELCNGGARAPRRAEAGVVSKRSLRSSREAMAAPARKKRGSYAHDDWQLRRASDMFIVGQMASGIAHDFNNRLQGVMSTLDLMMVRLEQGRASECGALVDAAENSLLRATHLAHRLLNFARTSEAVRTTIDVNAAVGSMEAVLKCLAGGRVDVDLELGAGPMLAFCDGHQFESALLNLVVNARDAMPDGGRLCIETCRAGLAVDTQGLRHGRYIRIGVSDTGCGMSRQVISRAFDPFFTTKPAGKGTGLGLPMIKAFVDQSEGHVDVQSAEGLGTAIAIYLPSRSAQPAQ